MTSRRPLVRRVPQLGYILRLFRAAPSTIPIHSVLTRKYRELSWIEPLPLRQIQRRRRKNQSCNIVVMTIRNTAIPYPNGQWISGICSKFMP